MKLKKTAAAILCAAITVLSITGCGEEEELSSVYGQAIKEVNASDIYRIYDGRYITDEEADAVASYFYSIQTQDYDLFCTTQPPVYIEYLDKQSDDYSKEYLQGMYDDEVEGLGGDYEYTQFEITDCGYESDDPGMTDVIEVMDDIYRANDPDTTFRETINTKKYIEYTLTAVLLDDESSGEYTTEGQILYIFDCDDGIYVLSLQ
jgi:hypothetical protein